MEDAKSQGCEKGYPSIPIRPTNDQIKIEGCSGVSMRDHGMPAGDQESEIPRGSSLSYRLQHNHKTLAKAACDGCIDGTPQ